MKVRTAPRPHKVGFKEVGASSGLVVPSFGFLISGFSADNPAVLRSDGGVDYVAQLLNSANDGEPWEQPDATQQPLMLTEGPQGRKVLGFPDTKHTCLLSSVNCPPTAPYWTEFYLVKVTTFGTYSTALMDWRKAGNATFTSLAAGGSQYHLNNSGNGLFSFAFPLNQWQLLTYYQRSGTFYLRVNGQVLTGSGVPQPIAAGINDMVLGRSSYFGSIPPGEGGWDFIGRYACSLGYAGTLTDEQILETETAIKSYYSDLISF